MLQNGWNRWSIPSTRWGRWRWWRGRGRGRVVVAVGQWQECFLDRECLFACGGFSGGKYPTQDKIKVLPRTKIINIQKSPKFATTSTMQFRVTHATLTTCATTKQMQETTPTMKNKFSEKYCNVCWHKCLWKCMKALILLDNVLRLQWSEREKRISYHITERDHVLRRHCLHSNSTYQFAGRLGGTHGISGGGGWRTAVESSHACICVNSLLWIIRYW